MRSTFFILCILACNYGCKPTESKVGKESQVGSDPKENFSKNGSANLGVSTHQLGNSSTRRAELISDIKASLDRERLVAVDGWLSLQRDHVCRPLQATIDSSTFQSIQALMTTEESMYLKFLTVNMRHPPIDPDNRSLWARFLGAQMIAEFDGGHAAKILLQLGRSNPLTQDDLFCAQAFLDAFYEHKKNKAPLTSDQQSDWTLLAKSSSPLHRLLAVSLFHAVEQDQYRQ